MSDLFTRVVDLSVPFLVNNQNPNVVYLGHLEYEQFKNMFKCNFTNKIDYEFVYKNMLNGYPIIKVDSDSYLAVGIVKEG